MSKKYPEVKSRYTKLKKRGVQPRTRRLALRGLGYGTTVASVLCRTFSEHGVASQFFVLRGTANGARVVKSDF